MKDKAIKRIIEIVGGVLLAIAGIFGLLFYLNIDSLKSVESNFYLMMYYTLFLIIVITVIAFLVTPVMTIFQNPKGLGKSIIFVVVLVGLVVLALLLAKGDPNSVYLINKPANLAKIVYYTEVGLYIFYFIAALSILGVLFSEVYNLFK